MAIEIKLRAHAGERPRDAIPVTVDVPGLAAGEVFRRRDGAGGAIPCSGERIAGRTRLARRDRGVEAGETRDQTAGRSFNSYRHGPQRVRRFPHPSIGSDNPRHPTPWHVRGYGLMKANGFAVKHYRPDRKEREDTTFRKGGVTTWRYRIYIHRGNVLRGKVGARFLDLVAPPRVTVE